MCNSKRASRGLFVRLINTKKPYLLELNIYVFTFILSLNANISCVKGSFVTNATMFTFLIRLSPFTLV